MIDKRDFRWKIPPEILPGCRLRDTALYALKRIKQTDFQINFLQNYDKIQPLVLGLESRIKIKSLLVIPRMIKRLLPSLDHAKLKILPDLKSVIGCGAEVPSTGSLIRFGTPSRLLEIVKLLLSGDQ